MVTINGVKVSNDNQRQENQIQKTPSINEILDKMQNNYNNLNYPDTQKISVLSNTETEANTNNNNLNNDNNLLLSILPLLLNKSGNQADILKSEQNKIFQSMIKSLNNPLLEKIFELLPKLNKKTSVKKVEVESKKNESSIDSFVKTSNYDINDTMA